MRKALGFVRKHWILTSFVLVNLGIAAPAAAGYSDNICIDRDAGEIFACCASCWLFCHCSS
ncbi:MAG: hypothetical protein R3E10_00865 [Gemmatimonadota bacterium]